MLFHLCPTGLIISSFDTHKIKPTDPLCKAGTAVNVHSNGETTWCVNGLDLQADRSSEDSGSRGDSSSDVFCDATKEGPLQFKQLSADKNKVRPGPAPKVTRPL